MFDHADLLQLADGGLVLAVPEAVPETVALTVRVGTAGFELLAGGVVLGRIDRTGQDVLSALRRLSSIEVLACPPDLDLTRARVHRATILDGRVRGAGRTVP